MSLINGDVLRPRLISLTSCFRPGKRVPVASGYRAPPVCRRAASIGSARLSPPVTPATYSPWAPLGGAAGAALYLPARRPSGEGSRSPVLGTVPQAPREGQLSRYLAALAPVAGQPPAGLLRWAAVTRGCRCLLLLWLPLAGLPTAPCLWLAEPLAVPLLCARAGQARAGLLCPWAGLRALGAALRGIGSLLWLQLRGRGAVRGRQRVQEQQGPRGRVCRGENQLLMGESPPHPPPQLNSPHQPLLSATPALGQTLSHGSLPHTNCHAQSLQGKTTA